MLPSDFAETWGLVVNEALATGLPVRGQRRGWLPPDLMRDGESGYVYPLGDVTALASSLERIRQRKADGYDWGPAAAPP